MERVLVRIQLVEAIRNVISVFRANKCIGDLDASQDRSTDSTFRTRKGHSIGMPHRLPNLRGKASARRRRSIWAKKPLKRIKRRKECLQCRGGIKECYISTPCSNCEVHYYKRCIRKRNNEHICVNCRYLGTLPNL